MISADLDKLAEAIRSNPDAVDSAVKMIDGLADQIVRHHGDPDQSILLANALRISALDLALAIQANTQPMPAADETPSPIADRKARVAATKTAA